MKKILIPFLLFISVSASAQYRALIEKDTATVVSTKHDLTLKRDTSTKITVSDLDTAALTTFDPTTKLNTSDTAAMLSPYFQKLIGTRFMAPSGYMPAGQDGGGTNDTYGANTIGVYSFYLPYTITVNSLSVVVTTAQASSTVQLGIYSMAGTKLLATGTIASTSTGLKTGTVTTTTLTPGFYIMAFVTNNTLTKVSAYTVSTSGFYDTVYGGTAANVVSGGVMPATLGTITQSSNNGAQVLIKN